MKRKLIFSFLIITGSLALMHCKKQTTPQPLTLQTPAVYSDEYYANLRAYKNSPNHQICYGWFSEYSQNYSYGQHFMGVPDSIDIISLWGGIPSTKVGDTVNSYNPTAYTEMRFVQKTKGTKMLAVAIVQIHNYPFTQDSIGITKFAQFFVDQVMQNDLDGFDCDYEPNGDFLTGANFSIFVKYLGQFLGPLSKNPGKLLVVDYYNNLPPPDTEPYVNYYVNQAYTQGVTTNSAANLQSRYNSVASYCPPRKFIVTENLGDWWATGGAPFTESNGNTLDADGNTLESLQGMERWVPTQGPKGGWGAFYFERDYNLNPPYKYMRRCLQEANPSIH